MAIPDEDVAKVRAAIDIGALIGEQTSLKRVGRRYSGLCPFHSEKSPSFSVNVEEGLYYCFGCGASGDAISFVRAVEGCDFVEAVERLAARAGVTVRNDADGADGAGRGRRAALYEALNAAADFYHERLLKGSDAGRARQYLRSRGYDGEVVRSFRIGFAPASYDALVNSKLLPPSTLREAGLAHDSSRGRLIDTFRERVIFPICDPGGRVIALGGRILPEDLRQLPGEAGPKYRNSAESPVYQKRATLYGLNWAKSAVTHEHEAIVCEGYTDVIGFFQAELPRAVATCGTALTEDHVRLLSRFARRIVLCFDADAAGENAAARLYEWEHRHEVELYVAALPPGSDPADLSRTDPEALRGAITAAQPFLSFRIDRALTNGNLTTPEGRARAAESALSAIAEHPNPLVRDQYLLSVADRTHHEPERLRELLETARTAPVRTESRRSASASDRNDRRVEHDRPYDEPPPEDDGWIPADPGASRSRRPSRPADDEQRAARAALVLCIDRPAEVAAWIREELFEDALQQEAFRALRDATSLHDAIEQASSEVADLLHRLSMSDDVDLIDPQGTQFELVRAATTRATRELEAEIRRSLADGDAEAQLQATRAATWAKGELEVLRAGLDSGNRNEAVEASDRLLAWLWPSGLEG